jgi:integrating conjugative element protein (TIGR03757 family)
MFAVVRGTRLFTAPQEGQPDNCAPPRLPHKLRMLTSLTAGSRVRSKYLLAIGCLLLRFPCTWAADVRVYTDAAHPVSASKFISVVHLDEPAHLQAELSKDLPKDLTKASQLLRARLRSDGEPLTRQLSAAYQGVVEAWTLGILKVPAIVVDGRYVVYGDSDVTHALSLIQRYRDTNP